jgi:large subunit ribosomal protein L22
VIEGRATARYVRTSAQKAKLVVDLIRGKDVDSALATLRFARKGVAKDVEKVLRSAIANAQQKDGAGEQVERLYVRECYADQGPTLKRIRAAPMGRAFRVLKRTSHLTVIVEERPEGEGGGRRRRARGGPAGTPGGAGRSRRRKEETSRAPAVTPEPDVVEPDTTPEPPEPEVPETDAVPEPEPEAPEPEAPDAPPAPEGESDQPPEPEEPEPEEPDEEPPTLPPGGILGIR